MAYGTNRTDWRRRIAFYVGKILKGQTSPLISSFVVSVAYGPHQGEGVRLKSMTKYMARSQGQVGLLIDAPGTRGQGQAGFGDVPTCHYPIRWAVVRGRRVVPLPMTCS
jgi:hypothetical protein